MPGSLAPLLGFVLYQRPQKPPQWPDHFPSVIAQVLSFDGIQEISHVQPFVCSRKSPHILRRIMTLQVLFRRVCLTERLEEMYVLRKVWDWGLPPLLAWSREP